MPNDTPEKTIGLDGKSYPEGPPKNPHPKQLGSTRLPNVNVWRYLERGGKRAITAFGTAEPVRMTFVCIGPRRP